MLVLKSKSIDIEFVKQICDILLKDGNLEDYNFELEDPTIDLVKITPEVKEKLGRKYCMAHLRSLKIVKDKLNGRNSS